MRWAGDWEPFMDRVLLTQIGRRNRISHMQHDFDAHIHVKTVKGQKVSVKEAREKAKIKPFAPPMIFPAVGKNDIDPRWLTVFRAEILVVSMQRSSRRNDVRNS